MKNHQGIPLFTPPFFYNRPMIDRRKCKTTNRRQKSNKEERSQDFPLSDVRILHRIRKSGKVGP